MRPMSLEAIGAFLTVLAAVFILGHLWFHFVEAILERIKKLFARRREPPAWHPLPREDQEDP